MTLSEPLAALKGFAGESIGPLETVIDLSRRFGRKSVMWKLRAAGGAEFYLKRHETTAHYEAELRALRDWLPSIPRYEWWQSPQLIASSPELGALIMTRLPGQVLEASNVSRESELRAYRLAGQFGSLLHSAAVDLTGDLRPQDYSRSVIDRYFGLAGGCIDDATLRWAESTVSGPGVWDGLKLVPVHCDYSPRNWLVEDGRNAIGVIDWERARPGYWVEDFHRMTLDHWWRRPALRDAYFDGYGREPSEKERRQAGMVSLVNAIGGVPWAIGHGDTQFEAHNRRVIATLRDVL